MSIDLEMPPKLRPGDRVAVLSPSFAAPGLFPERHEQALRRVREELGLEPVEFPTTRRLGATPADRAADLTAAYADRSIRAVFASIGGDDQITVLPHLDPAVFRADPKPFFGFSDNTNLLNWLWFHGLAGYHGGSTMMHLARGGGVQPVHLASLRAALFDGGDLVIEPVAEFTEEETDWAQPISLTEPARPVPHPGRVWHQPDRVVTGRSWGGNLEILHWNLAADRWLRPVGDYAGGVLLLETSEEMPPAEEVFRMLRNFGERGLLRQFPAVLVGTAKATVFTSPRPAAERPKYRDEQREAILRAIDAYHPEAMVVFGVDFGHTDPQWVLPYGGAITVDGPARTIVAHF
ncbi:muramoyltetrapeptide carboxypeptidase LdcA involved in peptidoglycan recycling [Actinoplanes octamycinicus]|uniref:Muramoyltetrapeptide carboxypeptidase LdcA involved in peptidoglycan recycling n=1 Tax=Actinoplanes octamycinicus TaxID=135948 RepID=A0A7W7GUN5_9ACTN|nr:S66 peptidase family protein [Actinoplanes octamycinicus]MBB4738594.1 muramoyltetrapeptide carboxypeptidase LdcA involved in peptidoglycan recycling [Actinoplanes octamycinicus]GIE57720.1 LD-carboxypeptidase [Actinoplanes octamycinicus]